MATVVRFATAVLLLLAGITVAAAAADRAEVESQFQAWLVSDIWPEAKAAGVSRAAFDKALAGVTLDWTLPELAPPGKPVKPPSIKWQTEFGSPGAYFNQRILTSLAKLGRGRIDQWRKTLGAIYERYGVPPAILVAIWAKESGFGQENLPEPAIRALATEAFIGYRKDLFRKELIAALQIVASGDVAPERMRSSWAGALGQPQFLPSLFRKYAVDFDRDGKRDIWGSVPDSLASMANYLKGEGWKRERGWGVEAKVPASVSCTLEGPEQGKPMAEWARLGVTQADGRPLPVRGAGGKRPGILLMPAGRFGPAFIVTENFYVLKQYNNSDLYALYIGHLADRFADDRPFVGAWQTVGGFSRGDVKGMQDQLVAEGYDVGNVDGLVGYKTRIAVGLWQEKQGQTPTCFPDAKLVRSIH
jgi:lytic murein transglycosylase